MWYILSWPFRVIGSLIGLVFGLVSSVVGLVFGIVGGILGFILNGIAFILFLSIVVVLVRIVMRAIRSL